MRTVQFIGYQLQTSQYGMTLRGNYRGLKDPYEDLRQRCRIMVDAIHAAAHHPATNREALKIFVAPEFFFRGGADGAYDVPTVSRINEILDPVLGKKAFRRWIFFLGTAVAYLPSEKGSDTELINMALIRKGGVSVAVPTAPASSLAEQEKDSVIVYKEYVSSVDFLGDHYGKQKTFQQSPHAGQIRVLGKQVRLQSAGMQSTAKLQRQAAANAPKSKPSPYAFSEDSATGLGGGTIFRMKGYQFVTEICLDHRFDRTRTVATGDTVFHIVTACGIDPHYVLSMEGGFLFVVDGLDYDPYKYVKLFRVEQGQSVEKNDFTTVPLRHPRHWIYHKEAGDNLFSKGKGGLRISIPYPIPGTPKSR